MTNTGSFLFTVFLSVFVLPAPALAGGADFLIQIEKSINISTENKAQLSVEKEQLERQIRDISLKLHERRVMLHKRMRALYDLKKFSWSELLTAPDSARLERNLKILGRLNRYDIELFKEYRQTLGQLALAKKDLIETDQLIQKNIDTLLAQQIEFHKLESFRLAQLKKENADSFLFFKKSISRPLESQPVQEFGSLLDQNNQYFLVNHGELYKTKPGSTVRAVGLGKVIFRDALNRWRETLIIQHDDNYYSVYAGIKAAKKNVGDRVEQNEWIGLSAENEFYFELRHFDNPINPKTWYRE